MSRVIRMVLFATLLNLLGAPLAVLQTVAWAKMAMTFSHDNSLRDSLHKTFDGHHPCALCLKIKKATQSGPSLAAVQLQNRLDGALPALMPKAVRIPLTWTLASRFLSTSDETVTPDSPPPKERLS